MDNCGIRLILAVLLGVCHNLPTWMKHHIVELPKEWIPKQNCYFLFDVAFGICYYVS